jgi:dTMP kinase
VSGVPGRRGLFIVLEGVEGSGKSTQARLLGEWLERCGLPHVLTREPGGTALGEEVRRLLLLGGDVPARAELLLMLAARATRIEQVVAPALDAGALVIADRYELSTLAYQAHGRLLPEAEVRQLNAFATAGLCPDLTLVLEVPVEVGEARRTGRAADRIEQAGQEFHRRVSEAYQLLAVTETKVERVDGSHAPDRVQAEIRRRLSSKFPETFARTEGLR